MVTAAAPATAVTATTTTAVTAAAPALSECRTWRESQTDKNHKCDKGFKQTESGHNPYLPCWERGFERGT
jgi:hypothetical protein